MGESSGDGQSSKNEAPPVLSFDLGHAPAVEREEEDNEVYDQLTSLLDIDKESGRSPRKEREEASPDERADDLSSAELSNGVRLGWLMDFIQHDAEEADQDEVVEALLRREAVVMEEVAQATALQKERVIAGSKQLPVWRALADVKGVDRQMVYEEAARVYGYEQASISREKPTTVFLHTVLNVFPPAIRKELIKLQMLPYKFAMDEEAMQQCLIVATHDPTHPDVKAFIHKLGLQVDLRYTPEALVRQRITSVQRLGEATGEFEEEEQSPIKASPEEDQAAPGGPSPVEDLGTDGGSAAKEPAPEGLRLVKKSSSSLPAPWEEGAVSSKSEVDRNGRVAELAQQDHPDLSPRFDSADLRFSEGLALEATQVVQNGVDLNLDTPVEDGAPPAALAGEEDVNEEVHAEAIKAIESEDRVVAMLLRDRIVTPDLVLKAKAHQEQAGSEEALWRILGGTEGTDREAVFAAAARLYGFSGVDLEEYPVNPDFARSVVERFADKQQDQLLELSVMPYESGVDRKTGATRLAFITHDPTRPKVHRVMHKLDIERFELKYAPESVVSGLIAEAFPKKNEYLERMEKEAGAVDLGMSHDDEGELIDEDALEAEMSRSKLINLFEATLVEGVREGASDIHIYPNANKKVEIHFRVDGRLKHWHTEEKVHPEALLAVIKDNAMNVDRFERDAAQDGFIQRKIDNALIRFRVSVLPIANASQEIRSESIVIRILDDRKVITNLNKLGLLDSALDRFNKAIRQPHGMVILTGPTGSGKSTTLVAALHQVVTPEVNVLTVEDPVEYIINGVRQIKLNNKLTLDGALRSILRHDPDIVMVGEMRDRHTAELAIKLANTGHLTFSTLHTNDAPSAISRLYKMGIEPFLIAYAINLVVAQRLIRRLCSNCKHVDPDPDPVLLEQLGFSKEEIANTTFYLPGDDRSCPSCGGLGYKGRRAISEALYFSRDIRHMIVEAEDMIDEGSIREQAQKEGMLTLNDSAREVVKLGDTSVREMIRVVSSE